MFLIVGFLTSILFWKKLLNKWIPFLIGFGMCAFAAVGNIINKTNALSLIVFAILSIVFAVIIALKLKRKG